MVRLMVYCEGETEEAFINEVLVPVLSAHALYSDLFYRVNRTLNV